MNYSKNRPFQPVLLKQMLAMLKGALTDKKRQENCCVPSA